MDFYLRRFDLSKDMFLQEVLKGNIELGPVVVGLVLSVECGDLDYGVAWFEVMYKVMRNAAYQDDLLQITLKFLLELNHSSNDSKISFTEINEIFLKYFLRISFPILSHAILVPLFQSFLSKSMNFLSKTDDFPIILTILNKYKTHIQIQSECIDDILITSLKSLSKTHYLSEESEFIPIIKQITENLQTKSPLTTINVQIFFFEKLKNFVYHNGPKNSKKIKEILIKYKKVFNPDLFNNLIEMFGESKTSVFEINKNIEKDFGNNEMKMASNEKIYELKNVKNHAGFNLDMGVISVSAK